MKIKGVLLGMAGMVAATGAYAADLPAAPAAPEPVDYVRVCDAFGTGFFYIPGTETCMKISGYVQAEYDVGITNGSAGSLTGSGWGGSSASGNWSDRDSNTYRFRTRANIRFDTRTNTEFGLLRTYTEMNWYNDDNSFSSDLDKAYIQFGGLTFGRAQSFFDFYTGVGYNSIFEPAHSDTTANLAAYTFAFGNGLSATASVEDTTARRTSIGYVTGASYDPSTGVLDLTNAQAMTNGYGGSRIPDVVANFRVDQAWGSAQVMAAGHQVWTSTALEENGAGTATGVVDPSTTSSKYGFAVGAGVTVNMPFLAAGDNFSLQGAYAQGAVKYTAPQATIQWVSYTNGDPTSYVTGGVPDGFIDPATGQLKLTQSWSVAAGLQHFFTPQVYAAIDGSYFGSKVDLPGSSNSQVNNWNLTGTVGYTPVAGLELGAALEYINSSADNNDLTGIVKSDNQLIGLVRVQRNF
ncbi:porin [Segnochrobactrum spirostomi]|uniref:Porin n=1 Tax=Segnochrobactrum spirostomi TaxID=2608987 RepID=A0A6A7Y3A8_9HYPH|nr:porin [Segnochrobactrum spirostomi]MQT13246.1 porin [Segnochrobactrum spirostomi]